MAFFNRLPNIEYDQKPLTYPYSERQYVLAKNFFRRYKISESSFNFQNFFDEYILTDEDRIDYLSYKFYGDSEFDWVILISNNIINSYFDLPINEGILYNIIAKKYDDPDATHHYETIEKKNSTGKVVLKGGLVVQESFFTSPFKYFDDGNVVSVPGNSVSYSISNYEYEVRLNTERRKIYILKPEYVQQFISEYESGMKYAESSSYINPTTKKSGV